MTCLDVGHGNCTIIEADGLIVVIDAGSGSSLLDYLDEANIEDIDVILISHADADHLAGLTAVLAANHVTIRRVLLNADSVKDTDAWDDILYSMDQSSLHGDLDLEVGWHVGKASDIEMGDLFLKALAPTGYLTGKGVGGKDRGGRRISSNSMSCMVRVDFMGAPVAILPGDIDAVGLDAFEAALAVDAGLTPLAPILVWPHHGGLPGGAEPGPFARRLLDLVQPRHVVFSNGRGKGPNPRPEIVAESRKGGLEPRIVCTQLSEACAVSLPPKGSWTLHELPGKGRAKNHSCGGSTRFNLKNPAESSAPDYEAHQGFITNHAPTALCRLANG